jgi:hypothetical protein
MATPVSLPSTFVTGTVFTAAQANGLRGAFRILQVINATTNTIVASTSTTWLDTNLSATITPQSTSSRIFVLVNQGIYCDNPVDEMGFRLVRAGTVIDSQLAPVFSSNSRIVGTGVFMELDAPNTTSAITYKTQFNRSTGAGIVYVNINSNFANMTLFEVSA